MSISKISVNGTVENSKTIQVISIPAAMPSIGEILLIKEPCVLLRSSKAAPNVDAAKAVAIPCKPRAINSISILDANKKKPMDNNF